MSLLNYIDNEVPAFGEWDAIVQAGSSTIVQTADASFPERGSVGLRVNVVDGGAAYARKNLPAAESILYAGAWVYLHSDYDAAVGVLVPFCANTSGTSGTWLLYFNYAGGGIQWQVKVYDWVSGVAPAAQMPLDSWVWLVGAIKRAAGGAGWMRLYMNGALVSEKTGLSNAGTIDNLRWGNAYSGSSLTKKLTIDFDEVKVAASYPEPYVPPPLTEYPEPRRTVMVYLLDNAIGRECAENLAQNMGLPRCNLCPTPDLTGIGETVADYATFQAKIENQLAAWLARNPTVAANVTTFLFGYGVPAYFNHGGMKYSGTSRVMRFGSAFSPQTDNPFYKPSAVQRLTVSDLRSAGTYLCTTVHGADGSWYGSYSTIVLPDAAKLYADDESYRTSLSCRHLRMITAPLGTYSDEAFIWGDIDTPDYGQPEGLRICYIDTTDGSAASFQPIPGSKLYQATHYETGFVSGLGNSAAADGFDAASFFEMLRIGGSFAEAAAVAVEHLDYTSVAAGLPVLAVNFQLGGYNIYRGEGGLEGVDWNSPAAYARPENLSVTVPLEAKQGERYVFAARAVSQAGIEERNTSIFSYMETDELGGLMSAPLAQPDDVTAELVPNGCVLLGFSYRSSPGCQSSEAFDVFTDNGTGTLNLDAPVATITEFAREKEDFELLVEPAALPAMFAVRASAGQRNGPLSRVVVAKSAPAPQTVKTL